MTLVHRVLFPTPIQSLDEYLKVRGGGGLDAARRLTSEEIIVELEASGLRGRGGAGFPTGRKWRTVRDYCSAFERTSVVVNAAEGEPGTFKDRTILLNDPYQVLEGALIGCVLGSVCFMGFDDTDDLVAAATGASGFLAVESCGQCTP